MYGRKQNPLEVLASLNILVNVSHVDKFLPSTMDQNIIKKLQFLINYTIDDEIITKSIVQNYGSISLFHNEIVSILKERPGKRFTTHYLTERIRKKVPDIDLYKLKRYLVDCFVTIQEKTPNVVYVSLDNEIYYRLETPEYCFDDTLPPGWSIQYDLYRNPFYVNHNTRTTQWERPH